MKTSHCCPKCDSEEVLHVPELHDSDGGQLGLGVSKGLATNTVLGALEAYVCPQCGYTELYVASTRFLSVKDLKGARVLKAGKP